MGEAAKNNKQENYAHDVLNNLRIEPRMRGLLRKDWAVEGRKILAVRRAVLQPPREPRVATISRSVRRGNPG